MGNEKFHGQGGMSWETSQENVTYKEVSVAIQSSSFSFSLFSIRIKFFSLPWHFRGVGGTGLLNGVREFRKKM